MNSSNVNYRGHTYIDIENDVKNGEKQQKIFQLYLLNKYDIELIGQDRYCKYDFIYNNNLDNIYIEYKALVLKPPKYLDELGKPTYYDDIMIGADKIEHYLNMYEKALKKNRLLQFYYIISFNWIKGGLLHRVYYYSYLDLNYIIKNCRVDEWDNKKHYYINFKNKFRQLKYFQSIINKV